MTENLVPYKPQDVQPPPIRQKDQSCENCRFWGEEDDAVVVAEVESRDCRRNAPVPGGDSIGLTRWPLVMSLDWCGEWEDEAEYEVRRTREVRIAP